MSETNDLNANNLRVSINEFGFLSLSVEKDDITTPLYQDSDSYGKDDIWHIYKITRDPDNVVQLVIDNHVVWAGIVPQLSDFAYLAVGRYGDFDEVYVTDDWCQ